MSGVLLVEAHGLLRTALEDLLAGSGFDSVLIATDPLEAVQQTVRRAPRIIVLDTLVPEMEGFCLSQMLRELAPQSKIVLLIENAGQEYQQAARTSGADAFVAKSELAVNLPRLLTQWGNQAA